MNIDYAWHDLLGNIGVFLVVFSYFLLQIGRISGVSPVYALVNAGGAALVLISLYFNFNLSAVLIEGFWLAISLLGLFLHWQRKPPLRKPGRGAAASLEAPDGEKRR